MNRVVGVYEREVAIRMVLDRQQQPHRLHQRRHRPLHQQQRLRHAGAEPDNIDNVIGPANYDIGHVFIDRRRRSRQSERAVHGTARRAALPASPTRSATHSTSTTWPTRWGTSSAATTPSTAPRATAAGQPQRVVGL